MTKNYKNLNSKVVSRIIRDGGGVTSDRHQTGWVRFAHTAPYRKCGFTLAEVLITLAIVGVVAALTLPNLIANYQRKQAVTKLKAVYSILDQTFTHAMAEHGDVSTWMINDIYGQTTGDLELTKQYVETYILPYIITTKNYGVKTLKYLGYKEIYHLDGSVVSNLLGGSRYFVTIPSGAILGFSLDGHCYEYDENESCVDWRFTIPYIVADINGLKKPNVVGKDFFVFTIQENKFGFYCYRNHSCDNRATLLKYCSKGSAENRQCGKLIQMDGWQMKDDYPW